MTVIAEIAAERQRQISREGWSVAHDDEHDDCSLAGAAACYALPERHRGLITFKRLEQQDVAGRGECPIMRTVTVKYTVPQLWPASWHPSWWKPKDRRRDLIRAAALIVAEIERLDRDAQTIPSGSNPSDGNLT